ncbi:ribonuclease P protein component [Marinicellulosiphila megalodicopiae]|uniref:ribonuclease P protein component n=1 Tax=Marinicellulosiphila megalodicopiae TaxID=2724896 RepID=UPI003BAEA47E
MKKRYEFARTSRLLTPGDFRNVFDHVDAKISCSEITLLAKKTDLDTNRIGFIIAKKQVKTAVARNRIKRHFRENFRIFNKNAQNLQKFDFIVLARKATQDLDNPKLDQTIQSLLKRLKKRIENTN